MSGLLQSISGLFGQETSETAKAFDAAPVEATQAKLEDSNIAGIGSQENRDLRKEAAQTEKEFKGAGTKVGLEIWRVENKRTKSDTPDFGIKRWPKDRFGEFFTGDSYIVLNTYKFRDPVTNKITDKLVWDLHFWLGSESSQDEIGVAAYKTVELDDLLDDGPIQRRETQYNESKLFQSYFKEIIYLEGGIASGFRKVKPEEYEPRLFMVRSSGGAKATRAFQIDAKAEYLNHGDVFVLDAGRKVYRWIGESSNPFERNKSGLLQSNIINSRNGKAKKVEIDDEFWSILGGTVDDVRGADNPYIPETIAKATSNKSLDKTALRLFRISDASGSAKFTLEAEGHGLHYNQLDSNDCFLLETNVAIWIWIGIGSTKNEKQSSFKFADEYILKNGIDVSIPVISLKEKTAPQNHLFMSMFQF